MAQADPTEVVVVRDPGILGGCPIFRGTRVPVDTVFDHLVEGVTLDEILENFPTLDRDDVEAAITQACRALKAAAPEVTTERPLARIS